VLLQGYQGKRIDNTSVRDEPYSFVLGGDGVRAAAAAAAAGGVAEVAAVPGVNGSRRNSSSSSSSSEKLGSKL
jgi:hypothetical protein